MTKYMRVAKIAKTRKKQGGSLVREVDGLPCLLSEGMRVHVVPPMTDHPCDLTVAHLETGFDGVCVVFDGIDDIDDLVSYEGRYLLAAKADIDPLLLQNAQPAVLDCEVTDRAVGMLGTVVDILSSRAQDTLVIRSEGGEEYLVPFVEDFILDFDADNRTLLMDLPKGLVDGGAETIESTEGE